MWRDTQGTDHRGHSGPAVVVHPVIDSPVGAVASPSPIPVRSVPPSPVGFKPASEPGCKGGRPGGTSVKLSGLKPSLGSPPDRGSDPNIIFSCGSALRT